jgi:phosphate transport system substrate-binding protein
MRFLSRVAVAALLAAALGCSANRGDRPAGLRGAGSTFISPAMVQWAVYFERREGGCKVEYRGVGSEGGVRALTQKKVDFGRTDAPMTDAQMAEARAGGGDVVHVPLALGAVVAAYNLDGVKDPLRFTGPVLADIFLGKIKKWNDDALRTLNPNVPLPDAEIRVERRRDGSGTTYIWTEYLSKVSPEWKQRVGPGTEVAWPTGDAEAGNDGVARRVRETPHSIGYVELSHAYREDLAFGLVQNRAGEFVKAGIRSVTAAGNSLTDLPDDLRFSLTDAPGKDSYPVCATTWAVAYVNQPSGKGHELADFLAWVISDGQELAEGLFYARLPEPLVARAMKKVNQVRAGD